MLNDVASIFSNALTIAMTLFLSAAGLTLLFGVLKILNFAHGTFIMVGAYIASMILGKAFFGPSWFLLSAVVAGCAVAVVGVVVDTIVFRRLRHVDDANILIVTFALMLVMQGAVKLIWGSDFVSVNMPTGLDGAYIISGLIVPQFSVFLWAVGFATFIVLDFFITRLWVGKVLQSVARDPWIMGVFGYDVKTLILLAVMISFFLAGFAGGILVPNQTLQPSFGDSVIIQAFAVVIVGGLGSIRGAFLASLLLGLAESLGSIMMPSMALYLGIIVILLVRPQGLITGGAPVPVGSWMQYFRRRKSIRESTVRARRPAVDYAARSKAGDVLPVPLSRNRFQIAFGAVAVIALLSVPWWGGHGFIFIVSFVLIQAIFAMSWNMLFGFAGMVTFGHAGFFAIGAYFVAVIMKADPLAPFLPVLAGAGLVGALLAAPIGAIALRRSGGLQLAILTLALSEVLRVLFSHSSLLSHDEGINNIPRPMLGIGPLSVSLSSEVSYFWFLCVACSGIAAFMWWLTHQEFGRVLRCIKQDPERAAFIGVNIDRYRLAAFVIASGVAAVAGALAAPLVQIVTPESASIAKSTEPMLNTLLGGAGTFWGPLVGTGVFAIIQYATRTLAGLSEFIMGVILLLVVLAVPGGIVGMFSSLNNSALARLVTRGNSMEAARAKDRS